MRPAEYGRKIGTLTVDIDDRTAGGGHHRGECATFDLRYHRNKGFTVIHDAKAFTADSEVELEKLIAEVLRTERRIVWTKYIVVEYESAQVPTRHRGGYTHDNRSLQHAAPDLTRSVELDWYVTEFSDVRHKVGDDVEDVEEHYLERCDGVVQERSEIDSGAIVFTPERLAVLEQIRYALTSLDRKLRGFLGTDASAIAAALDVGFAATGLPALPAPEPSPHLPHCKSLTPVGECDEECDDIDEDTAKIRHHYRCNAHPLECDCGKE